MRATSLKGKHVETLLQRWQAEGLSAGTLKNRMAHLRWWAEKVGKAGVIATDNAELGIAERRFVADENKARELGNKVDRIRDPYVRMSLALQQAFGLRRAGTGGDHLAGHVTRLAPNLLHDAEA